MLGEGRCRSSSSVPVTPHGAGTKPPPPRPFLSQHGKCKLRALFGASRTACRGAPLPAVTPLRRHRPFLYLKTLPAIAKRPPTDTDGRANRPPRLIPIRGALWRSLQPPSTAPSPHDELRAPPPRLTCAASAAVRGAPALLPAAQPGAAALGRGPAALSGFCRVSPVEPGHTPISKGPAGSAEPGFARDGPKSKPHVGERCPGAPWAPADRGRAHRPVKNLILNVQPESPEAAAAPRFPRAPLPLPESRAQRCPWAPCGEQRSRPGGVARGCPASECTRPRGVARGRARGVARGRATWSCSCRARQGRAASPRSFLEQRLSSRDH